jgi:hypothetical protein
MRMKNFVLSRCKIGNPDECWEWQGCLNSYGYGVFIRNKKTIFAHRVMVDAAPGECALHHCDNRKCCNPAHIFKGDRADNMRDMYAKGRRVYTHKLTMAQVKIIRNLRGKVTGKELAATYHVSISLISMIQLGKHRV